MSNQMFDNNKLPRCTRCGVENIKEAMQHCGDCGNEYCWTCSTDNWCPYCHPLSDPLANRNLCGFERAWVGKCKEPVSQRGERCKEHQLSCDSCGEPATHQCHETGQFVCGSPLCDKCEHLIFPDGTNGGIGFNTLPLPEGLTKRHVKKTEQKYRSYYMQDKNSAER